MLKTITRAELVQAGGDPEATHCVFDALGDLYFCVHAKLDEPAEEYFWAARQCEMKKVVA